LIVWFIPEITAALIYQAAHLESRSIFEVGLLPAIQVAIGCLGAALIFGHFREAMMIVVVFAYSCG
jgi:hypothetical protein